MSAESPKSIRSQIRTTGTTTVVPQQVTDPTILDSVAGFIQDVVPTAYNVPYDSKDQIQWAHFEQLENDQTNLSPNLECDKIIPPPLLLILGYTTGIQIWAIPANGEAVEILSWRHGSVKTLKILPEPYIVGENKNCIDLFAEKRPLIALCDNASPGPHFCTLSFLSLKTGEQVKVIKFKNPILNVLANKHSVVVAFSEKIAVFDAFTLEDKCTVTTCYLSPGLQPNPISLGTRWLAYAEKKLNPSCRSSGGNDGEGVQSYTATVLHAAKSLGRGLRELGETVASSLTGNPQYKPGFSPGSPQAGGQSDVPQKGIVTILDIENAFLESAEKSIQNEAVVAHFAAHTEAIVCLQFDPSGMLLLTADKRGHDFHLFRIYPHPGGPSLAAVHHLYVLHRGDTSAKVQDMCFSPDSRWVAVSTLRGTTHVFPITPYGGTIGVRTHTTPHVVNKMSRFHRSAGLTAEGRSNSPVSVMELPANSHFPYHNPRFPPFPHPTKVNPLAQIRQPVYVQNIGNVPPRSNTGRPRLSSSSEENISLRVVACFAQQRAYIDGVPSPQETPLAKQQVKPVDSLFVMSCHGNLVQYDLDPRPSNSIPKERICDDSPIDLNVTAKAQWSLQRQPYMADIPLPFTPANLSLVAQSVPQYKKSKITHNDDQWLSQVEIVTHAGPHRRLWMGPQFTFKTYTTTNGSPMSVVEIQPLDVGRSKPVNMPITKANAILIESGSAGSCEQTLLDTYQKTYDEAGGIGELQLKEDLADAMMESTGIKESTGGRCVIVSMKPQAPAVAKVVNPLGTVVTLQSDEDTEPEVIEDAVIHENCDETLFRPVVTPKPALSSEYKNLRPIDTIITKNLDPAIGVAVKIISKDKNSEKIEKNNNKLYSARHIKTNAGNNGKNKNTAEELKGKAKYKNKPAGEISECLVDTFAYPTDKELDSIKMLEPKPLETIECSFSLENQDRKSSSIQLASLENEMCPEITAKGDTFEDATDCCTTREAECDLTLFDASNQKEEKANKKLRKPKAKLGIKIANVPKEPIIKSTDDGFFSELSVQPPKKSWSAIAASKSKGSPGTLLDLPEKESYFDLPEIENFTTFTVQLPKKTYSSCITSDNLIDIDTPEQSQDIESCVENKENEIGFLKCSDDEKIESSSSPAETTESDDSGKVTLDVCAEKPMTEQNSSEQTTKVSKRKSKKKRK